MYRVRLLTSLIIVACVTLFMIAPRVSSGQSILLDPGHGGPNQPGATPPNDATCQYEDEAAAVMDIADNAYNKIFSGLSNEWSVYITRDGDNKVTLNKRSGMANGAVEMDGKNNPLPPSGVDFFLSIHADGASDNTAHGSSIIYPNEDIYDPEYVNGVQKTSRIAATVFLTFHVQFTRGTWNPSSPISSSWYSKGVYADVRNLHVLRETEMEAALLELDFMTYKNGHACQAMANHTYRDSAGIGIRESVDGLDPTSSGDNFVDRYIESTSYQNITPTWSGVTVFENKADDEVPGNGRKTYEVTGQSVTVPSGSWLIIDRETSAIFTENTALDGMGGWKGGPAANLDDIPFDGVFENRVVIENDKTLNWGESIKFDKGLYVKNGATLTVESGNTLEFSQDDSVYVEEGGKIVAQGTSSAPIRFTDRDQSWRGLQIEGDGSSLKHVTVERVGIGSDDGQPALEIRAQNVTLEDATITTNEWTAIKAVETNSGDATSFTLRSSLISGNEWGIDVRNTDAIIRNTTVKNNYDVGVHFGYGSSSPEFVNNTVRGNGLEGVQVYGGTIDKFKNNNIKNNGQYGLELFDSGAYVYMDGNSQNRIYNNEYHEVRLGANSKVYLGDASIDEGGYNEIYDSDHGYSSGHRYVKNRTSWTIPAEMNDWGGPNNDPVSSSMFDGPVDYEPFVTPPLTAFLSCAPADGSGTVSCYAGATGGGGNYNYDWNKDSCDGSSTCTVPCGGVYVSVTVTDDLGNTASASTTTGDCADDCNTMINKICLPSPKSLYSTLDERALRHEIDSLKALLTSAKSSDLRGSSAGIVQNLHQLYGLSLLKSRVDQVHQGKLSAPTGAFSNGQSEVHSLVEGYATGVKDGTAESRRVRDAARRILLENMIRTRQFGQVLSDAQTYAKSMSTSRGRAQMHLYRSTAYARQGQYDQALQAVDAAEKSWPERSYASRRMLFLRRSGDPRWQNIAEEQRNQKRTGRAATNLAAQSKKERSTPEEFALRAPYPNPVSSTATLPLALPERAHVRATVYDVLGRRIGVLADRSFAAGRPKLKFSAGALAGGLYVVRVKVTQPSDEKRLFTERVTVLK